MVLDIEQFQDGLADFRRRSPTPTVALKFVYQRRGPGFEETQIPFVEYSPKATLSSPDSASAIIADRVGKYIESRLADWLEDEAAAFLKETEEAAIEEAKATLARAAKKKEA